MLVRPGSQATRTLNYFEHQNQSQYPCSLFPDFNYFSVTTHHRQLKKQKTTMKTARYILLAIIAVAYCTANAQVITRVTGNGRSNYTGDGGNAANAACFAPAGITYHGGNIYFADKGNHAIRMIDASGIITTIAGRDSSFGFSGDNGPATAAFINSPTSIAFDAAGNLYFTDDGNNRIRKINTSGIITTIVGTGVAGNYGDNGPATNAQLNHATGVVVNDTGAILIADANNHVIRMIDTAGKIHTLVGVGRSGYSGDGGYANIATLNYPKGLALDAAGNLYIADNGNSVIRKVTPAGIISAYAGNGTNGYGGDGGYGYQAQLSTPTEITIDASGDAYIADFGNHVVRKVTRSGTISTFAGNGTSGNTGDGGYASSAQLSGPYGTATDGSGNVYITDEISNVIRMVHRPNAIATVQNEAEELFILPNPNSGTFQIQLPVNDGGTISVYDVTGRVIATQNHDQGDPTNLTFSQLSSGMYVVTFIGKTGTSRSKVVVQ